MWFDPSMLIHGTGSDLEHVPMMDFAGLFHALVRWLWP
jgi:hypothetical protein